MGLDMTLIRKTSVNSCFSSITVDDIQGQGIDHICPSQIKYVVEEMAYWCKANAIHNWFVENIQNGKDDCNEYDVDKNDLENLLKLVNKVLKTPSKAKDLLPTKSGFFFGSTEYDDIYLSDLQYTKEILEKILAEPSGGYLCYQASW